MSSYTEDTQETAVASDFTWIGIASQQDDSARAVDMLKFGLGVVHADAAVASDEVIGAWGVSISDSAVASDVVTGKLSAVWLLTDRARASEVWRQGLTVVHSDAALASDELAGVLTATTLEQAVAIDVITGHLTVTSLAADWARASDWTKLAFAHDELDEAVATDAATGKLRATVLVVEAAQVGEAFTGQLRASSTAADAAQAVDQVSGHLSAQSVTTDVAVAEDWVVSSGEPGGQAWTANTENWATSRYAPYTFRQVVVINRKLFGVADDGVYALEGGTEEVQGALVTGALDLGGGRLTHPRAVHMEYELDGLAALDVTQTQSGAAESWTYTLPPEPAVSLTNGRFVLGRGLRGTHFSLALRLKARRGRVETLSVVTEETKRRI